MGNATEVLINSAAIFQKIPQTFSPFAGCVYGIPFTRGRGSLICHTRPSLRNAIIPYQFKSNSYQARP
jgi:hypothetical protein